MVDQDQPRTVLIADDDRQLRGLLAEFLVGEGFEVLEAGDGVEAIRAVQRARPDAILLDITMPRLGGLRTLESVRALDPDIQVVIVTGTLDPASLRHALFSGATTVLTKPLQLDDVAAALRAQPGEAGEAVTGDSARRAGGGRSVLVVDDEPEFRAMLGEILTCYGYDVRMAADGASALRAVEAHAPDLVLLDVQMPDVNGIDVLASIRAIDPDVKVIMITGITRQTVANQAFAQGVFDYIGKPIDPAYLELSIATALDADSTL